jgi:3-mercaptopyruvate sulfurtransferase SseA
MNAYLIRDFGIRPLLLILVCLVLGVVTNMDFAWSALRGERKLSIEDRVAEAGETDLPRIGLEEAATAFIDGKTLFIDARDEDAFDAGHIPSAIDVPWEEAQYDYSLIDRKVPHGTPLITYCDGSDCDASILLGAALRELGYENVRVFFGGWVEWEEADYPIEEEFPE